MQTRVFLEGHEVTAPEWRSRKAKELLLFLLCRREAATKEELIDALWPESTGGAGSSALKTTIYRLRRALYPELAISEGGGYFVNPEAPIKFDLYRFEHCLDLAGSLGNGSASNLRIEGLEKALEIYKGPFLNESYAEWCQPFQRELDAKFKTALQTLADHHIALHDYPRAISVLLKAVSSDPYDEVANYGLIQAYDLAGDIHSARQRREAYYKKGPRGPGRRLAGSLQRHRRAPQGPLTRGSSTSVRLLGRSSCPLWPWPASSIVSSIICSLYLASGRGDLLHPFGHRLVTSPD